MALSADKAKRSFEFRMSKKVAELTQVVHMLFTRNHEKEVEIEALKEAYEFEISEVIADARVKIADLEKQLEDMLRQQGGETDRIRKLLEGEFQCREQDWNKRLEESDRMLQEERTECQNLRDMLIRAQRDIENLRQGVSEQLSSQADEVSRRDKEIERLKKHIAALEQSVKECGKESSDIIKDLERSNEKLERELRHIHGLLDESHRTRDGLLMRNKQLEADMKSLKRDFNKKVAEVIGNQKLQRNGPVQQRSSLPTPQSSSDRDSRFPSICSTPEQRQRPSTNNKLVKPKPLPKEMLFSK
nr:hypothetical protein BaRGS_029998 [Batillaria attramentaria]